MTAPAPTDPLATWTPQAALGLTCTSCHPEYRDAPSPVRPDVRGGTTSGEHEEAWRPVAPHGTPHGTAAPAAVS